MPDLSVKVGDLKLANPLIAASGCFAYGREYDPLLPPGLFGAVVTKTVTPLPRPGNPPPRLIETPAGMLNSIGLENVGLDAFLADKLPALADCGTAVIVSISAESADSFAAMAAALADSGGIAALELNLSCPNVAAQGRNFAVDEVAVEEITRAVAEVFPGGPVWVKLSPNVTDITRPARAAARGGADAVTAINTLLGLEIDPETGRSPFTMTTAGLSGPAIRPVALAAVQRIARGTELPVIGVGGIHSTPDVIRFLGAGASAVQIGTALFTDPDLPARMLAELDSWLADRDLASFDDLRAMWRKED